MDKPRLTYVPREDVTRETERAVLAAIFSYIIRCHEQKRAAEAANGERRTEVEHSEEPLKERKVRGGSG